MRILFLSNDGYPPYRVDVADLVAGRLAARGHRIDWVLQAREPGRPFRKEAYGGGTAWIGRSLGRKTFFSTLGSALLDLAHDLRLPVVAWRRRPQLVIVRDKVVAALLGLFTARWLRMRFAYWHSYPIADAALTIAAEGVRRRRWLAALRGRLSHEILYRFLLPRADHVFVQSEQMARDLAGIGVAPNTMTPVPMGVALERVPEPYPVTRVVKPMEQKWIVYLGTLSLIRRLDVLVAAVARVRSRCPDCYLYLVGAGDNARDERALGQVVASHGLTDAVVFTGFLPMEHAWEYVALADVCVSPFRDIPVLQSTSPTKLLEYMALGRPVVASRHPEQDVIVNESGAGVLADYTDEAFAEAILRLLEDPTRRAAMGPRGRAWVERHRNYDRIADLVEATMARVVEPAPGHGAVPR